MCPQHTSLANHEQNKHNCTPPCSANNALKTKTVCTNFCGDIARQHAWIGLLHASKARKHAHPTNSKHQVKHFHSWKLMQTEDSNALHCTMRADKHNYPSNHCSHVGANYFAQFCMTSPSQRQFLLTQRQCCFPSCLFQSAPDRIALACFRPSISSSQA